MIPTGGIGIDIGTTQSVGITVDNYSNQWLRIGSEFLFVPPFTISWASNFYGSVAGSLIVRIDAPSGITQNTPIVNGDVTVALYDTPVLPNPGVSSTSSSARIITVSTTLGGTIDSPSAFGLPLNTTLPIVWSLPIFTGQDANGGRDYYAQRALTDLSNAFVVCAAGVDTLLITIPPGGTSALLKRVLFIVISTDVASRVQISNTTPSPIFFNGFLAANTPFQIVYYGNGFFPNISQIRGTHTVGGTIGITAGFGEA